MEGFSDRSINDFQEYLQNYAPNRGCRLETLYKLEEERSTSLGFRARVVLLDARDGIDSTRSWSSWHSSVKPARKEAAWLALRELQSEQTRPHDDMDIPVVVHATHRSGGGGRSELVLFGEVELPELFLGSEGVFLEGVAKLPLQQDDFILFDADECHESESDCLTNVGRLGENYAVQWLAHQSWVKPGSVVWLNEHQEFGKPFDIICEPVAQKGRRFVEVKTHWKGFGRTCLSQSQLDEFAKSELMILVIGHFSNYFDSERSAPLVRCICFVPETEFCTIRCKIESDMMPFLNKKLTVIEAESETKVVVAESEVQIKGKTFSDVVKAQKMIESIYVKVKLTIQALEPKSLIVSLERLCCVKIESKYFYVDDCLVITFKGKLQSVCNARNKFQFVLKK